MYYIGNFQHFTDQEQKALDQRRYGDFSMMVQAASAEHALEKFRQRLMTFRASSDLFSGDCKIFITQLIEFANFPDDEAVLVNLKSYVGNPLLPYIACVVPTQQSDACNIHSYNHQGPTTEGQPDGLFLAFGAVE